MTLFAATSASAASAQRTIESVPWGASVAETRTRLEAKGWLFRGVDQTERHAFQRGTTELQTEFGPGVQMIGITWTLDVAAARRRYEFLVDSLRRALGRPDPVEYPYERIWTRGDTVMMAQFYDGRRLRVSSRAEFFGWIAKPAIDPAELSTRLSPRPADDLLDGAWRRLDGHQRDGVVLDTGSVAATAPGVYRVRISWEWWPDRRMVDGRLYDGVLREMEIDCNAPRWRTLREIPFLDERRIAVVDVAGRATDIGWRSPPAASRDARVLRAACLIIEDRDRRG
jgi:hypothetical protein